MEQPKEHILIVEDSPVNQLMLSKLLSGNGYEVGLADNADEALAFLNATEQLPDLIVLDIIMPGMNGYQLCQLLKKEQRFCDIPVIFISSLGDAADKIKGFEVGGVDYIAKPFHSGEVLARIHTHLKICRLQRELEEKNNQLNLEKTKSESLLLNVLPARVAQELIEKGIFRPKLHRHTAVCFADIVQFTKAAARLEPEVLIQELNDIFSGFDRIAIANSCERIKTIGDAYLCTSGIPVEDEQYLVKMAETTLEMIEFLKARNSTSEHKWQVRIGMHCGPVVGGIVGTEKYLFDIFGDAVNMASRLESLSQPMQINVSQDVFEKLQDLYDFSDSSEVQIKGKGVHKTCFLTGRKWIGS